MAEMSITMNEIAGALPELWATNPLAQVQLMNIVMAKRLQAAEAELAALKADVMAKNGVAPIVSAE